MIRIQYQVMAVSAAALLLSSCGGDDDSNPLKGIKDGLAEQCGIDVDCKAGGIVEGNASISGIASVDAFFQSVINFQSRANMVASGIDAEVSAIGASFGIEGDVAAGLKTQISANLEGGLKLEAEPAKCAVDAQASVDVAARCEGEVNPPKAMVACEGSCDVEASADVKCEGGAKLECTVQAPEVKCEGSCQGTCKVDVAAGASCSGTCNGMCDGECSAMNADGQCSGSCSGMCMGSCETKLEASATCEGTCSGECTVEKEGSAGCEGGVHAECKAQGMASVMCEGHCDGKVEPPSAKVECQASAKAEASMSVECTPPRIALHYQFKAGVDAAAQAKFEAGIRSLEAHLPALLASMRKAKFVVDAGADLGASAEAAVKGAVMKLDGGANLRVVAGIHCALGELGTVADTLGKSSAQLTASAKAATDLTAALK